VEGVLEKVIDVRGGRVEVVASVAVRSLRTFLLVAERGGDWFKVLYLGGVPFTAEGEAGGREVKGLSAFRAALSLEEADCKVYKLDASEVLERVRGREVFKGLPSEYLDLGKFIEELRSKPGVVTSKLGDMEFIAVSDGYGSIYVVKGDRELGEALKPPAAITYHHVLDPQRIVSKLAERPASWAAYRSRVPVFTSPQAAEEAIASELGDRRRVLEAVDGRLTCEEIASKASVPEETVAEVIRDYVGRGLIKLKPEERKLPTFRPPV